MLLFHGNTGCTNAPHCTLYVHTLPGLLLILPSLGLNVQVVSFLNHLNAELNPICHLLALLGAHHILHVSRIRVKAFPPEPGMHLSSSPYVLCVPLIAFFFISSPEYWANNTGNGALVLSSPVFPRPSWAHISSWPHCSRTRSPYPHPLM